MSNALDKAAEALSPAQRRYLYRVAGAALAILGVHGLVDAENAAAYLQAAAVLLAVAPTEVAARNVHR